MAINDALPERRNLVVTAFCVIVFYAAEGFVTDPTVRLAVVNVSFKHPEVLAGFVWGLLVWFQIRFWQSTRFKFGERFKQEIRGWSVPFPWVRVLIDDAERQVGGKDRLEPGYTPEVHAPELNGTTIQAACTFIYTENGHRVGKNQQRASFKSTSVLLIWPISFVRSLLFGNAVAEFLFPYVLFGAAVSAPIWSCWLWS
ncbi:hypothetical protein [Marinobacter sp. DUT-1]|uniref:hypothetical protein n=1 Tax=Marinobacter sp. DUT-1 TaxID=3412037 RepID=UPI003D182762